MVPRRPSLLAGVFVAARMVICSTRWPSGPLSFVAHGGWVGSWDLWQEPFELMQSRWRCIGYDHRRAGAEHTPPESITPAALVEDLFDVIDHYAVGPACWRASRSAR